MNWTNATVKLSELEPWDENPKSINRKQAKALLDYWQEVGQFQTLAVGLGENGKYPLYDGHQRLDVLMAEYGPDYEVDARVSSRLFSNDERAKHVLKSHYGTTGQIEWDTIAAWDTELVQEWGLDTDAMQQWQTDAGALGLLLESGKDGSEIDPALLEDKDGYKEQYGVIVLCENETEQESVFNALQEQGYACRVVVT